MIFRFDADGKIAEIKNNRADDKVYTENGAFSFYIAKSTVAL